jgi:ribosomal protein S18 acetylase RimI-like enzyme
VGPPEHVRRLWAAIDDLSATVEPTPWGAVVSDGRYPLVWDSNYARVETPASLHEVASALTPALRASRAEVFHVVMLDPDASTALLVELSSQGHRVAWDLVMDVAAGTAPSPEHDVEELTDGPELWEAVVMSFRAFGIEPEAAAAQLRRMQGDLLGRGVKRWFGVRSGGRIVSVAALVTLEGVGYIDDVATDPGSRGRGYATAVVSEIVSRAAARTERIVLLADPDEPRVISMYERLGFREIARFASTKGPIPQGTNL